MSPSFKVINPFLLPVASCTKAGFKLFYTTIQVTFGFECPSAWQDIFTGIWNIIPAIKFVDKGIEFCV